jgi:peptidoglycan/xylan/chitin deacetylase (PgdA/CDA1 family)
MNYINKKITIFITIDLENMNTPLQEGRYTRNLFSIETIEPLLEILEKLSLKAVFFASVFEYSRFGEDKISNVLQQLHTAGHEIQLHTHPSWCFDKEHMWQYSLEEQIKIIKHGKDLIIKWLGKTPVAHRAGAYGVNWDTIEALRRNQFSIDSSMFFENNNCKINWSANTVVCFDKIVEIPVTGFYRNYYLNLILFKYKYRRRFVKTDIDWSSYDELRKFIESATKHHLKVINLFMHSYSFIMHDGNYKNFQINTENTEKLETFLRFCLQYKNIQFMTMEEFLSAYRESPNLYIGNDYIPTMKRHVNIL